MFSLLLFYVKSEGTCNTNFKTFYGNEIKDTSTNTLGFKIESNCEVTLNGQKIDIPSSYIDVGEYTFTDTDGDHQISIKDVTEATNYRFFVFYATISPLLAMIDFVKNNGYPNDKIYMFFDRESTFDFDYLKETYSNIEVIHGAGAGDEIYEDLKKVLDTDPNAYVHIYHDDAQAKFYYIYGYNAGLQGDRFYSHIMSEGTLTYETWVNDVEPDFEKTKNQMLNNIKIAKKGAYLVDNTNSYNDISDLFALTQLDNCEFWVNIKSYISSQNENTIKEIEKMNIEQKLPIEMIHELPDQQKDIFHKIVKIDVDTFKSKYFPGENPPLFIIGTKEYGHFESAEQYKLNLEEVLNKYGDKYQIVYKPHPRYPPKDDKELNEFFTENNIPVVEDSLPFEVIMTSYDCYMGGFDSTVYLSAEPQQVLFFFAPGPDGLISITANLYKSGFFPDAIFINLEVNKLTAGEIAGIVIGVIAFIAIVVGVVIFFVIRSKRANQQDAEV